MTEEQHKEQHDSQLEAIVVRLDTQISSRGGILDRLDMAEKAFAAAAAAAKETAEAVEQQRDSQRALAIKGLMLIAGASSLSAGLGGELVSIFQQLLK